MLDDLMNDLSRRHGVAIANLDDILPSIERDAEHIAYLRMFGHGAEGEYPLQRVNYDDWREWMRIAGYELDGEPEEEDEDDEPWFEGDVLADEPEPEAPDPYVSDEKEAELRGWKAAMVHFIVHVAARNVLASRMAKIRVRAYGPKGHASHFSRTFVVENLRFEAQVEPSERPPPPQAPPDTLEEAEVRAAMPGMSALASGYERHNRHVLDGTERLLALHERITQRAYDELGEVRKDVNALYREIAEERRARVDEKVKAAEAASDMVRSEQEATERRELIKQTVDQFGEVAKAVLVAKGVPADLVPVLERLNGKPDLMAALKDPNVLEMLEDPEAVEGLSELLKQAAAQAVAHKRAQADATESTAGEGDEPPPPPA